VFTILLIFFIIQNIHDTSNFYGVKEKNETPSLYDLEYQLKHYKFKDPYLQKTAHRFYLPMTSVVQDGSCVHFRIGVVGGETKLYLIKTLFMVIIRIKELKKVFNHIIIQTSSTWVWNIAQQYNLIRGIDLCTSITRADADDPISISYILNTKEDLEDHCCARIVVKHGYHMEATFMEVMHDKCFSMNIVLYPPYYDKIVMNHHELKTRVDYNCVSYYNINKYSTDYRTNKFQSATKFNETLPIDLRRDLSLFRLIDDVYDIIMFGNQYMCNVSEFRKLSMILFDWVLNCDCLNEYKCSKKIKCINQCLLNNVFLSRVTHCNSP
jgi:hypothetical protein